MKIKFVIRQICIKFNMNADIYNLIYQQLKNSCINLIIKNWYKFLYKTSIKPFNLLFELSRKNLQFDNITDVENIRFIQKNLRYRTIVYKEIWEVHLLNIAVNLGNASRELINRKSSFYEYENFYKFKNQLIFLNSNYYKNGFGSIHNIHRMPGNPYLLYIE